MIFPAGVRYDGRMSDAVGNAIGVAVGDSEKKEEKSLIQALDLQTRDVVSLVGAGGKTTLLFRLARELHQTGRRVVTTTTTKILEPGPNETPQVFVDSDEAKIEAFVRGHLERYGHLTVAAERLGAGKLRGISPGLVLRLWNTSPADDILIEADGAAGRPVKAPREQEPVIPPGTTVVVAVLGIDGVDTHLDQKTVFQPERVARITGIRMGERITPDSMSILMTHPEGVFKGKPATARAIAFLNKVDIAGGMEKAEAVVARLVEREGSPIERVILGQLKGEPPVRKVLIL